MKKWIAILIIFCLVMIHISVPLAEPNETHDIENVIWLKRGEDELRTLKYEFCTSSRGEPAVRVYFEYKNNSSTANWSSSNYVIEGFADDISVLHTFAGSSVDEDYNGGTRVRNGKSIIFTEIFAFENNASELEIFVRYNGTWDGYSLFFTLSGQFSTNAPSNESDKTNLDNNPESGTTNIDTVNTIPSNASSQTDSEMELLSSENEELKATVKDLEEQIETISSNNSDSEEKIKKLSSENEELQTKIKDLEKQIGTMSNDNSDSEERIKKLSSENEELKTKVKDLESQIETMSNDDSDSEEKIKKLSSENEELKTKVKDLESQIETMSNDDSDSEEKSLEEMSVKELKELRESINEILGDSGSTTQTNQKGSVSGNISWYYNDYKGSVADTDSTIILMPTDGSGSDCPVMDSYVRWSMTKYLDQTTRKRYEKYNIFIVEVDGTGQYHIQNVPEGDYLMFIKSNNTTSAAAFDNITYYKNIISGTLSRLIGKENADQIAEAVGYQQFQTQEISVYPGQESFYSYDFGKTYI